MASVRRDEKHVDSPFTFVSHFLAEQMAHLLAGNRQNPTPLYNDPDNYNTKYPPDAEGEELDENARIWRVYNDEAREFDRDMVQNWRETIDILLVFAGLFSAAVTTLVTQASLSLEPDYAKVSALLLAELVNERRANSGGTNVTFDSPAATTFLLSENFNPSTIDHWTCGLWFTSLALSLSTSLACVVVKQWLSGYMSTVSAPPRVVASVRQFRYLGLEAWRVPFIIGTLPQVLVLSLFLFLSGLVTFLYPRSQPIAITIVASTALSSALYLASAIASAISTQCPYRTSLSSGLHYLWVSVIGRLMYRLFETRRFGWETNLRRRELEAVTREREKGLAMESLCWLHSTAQAQVVIDLVIGCLSALVDVPDIGFKSKLPSYSGWFEAFQHVCVRRMRDEDRSWLYKLRFHLFVWFIHRKQEEVVEHWLIRAFYLVWIHCATMESESAIFRIWADDYKARWSRFIETRRQTLVRASGNLDNPNPDTSPAPNENEASTTSQLPRGVKSILDNWNPRMLGTNSIPNQTGASAAPQPSQEVNVDLDDPNLGTSTSLNSSQANAAPQPPQEAESNSNDFNPGPSCILNQSPASATPQISIETEATSNGPTPRINSIPNEDGARATPQPPRASTGQLEAENRRTTIDYSSADKCDIEKGTPEH